MLTIMEILYGISAAEEPSVLHSICIHCKSHKYTMKEEEVEPSVLHSSCVHCKSHKYTMKEEEVQSFC